MTADEVKHRVQHIRESAHDHERAHSLEDALHQDVLRALAKDGHAIAAEALKTSEITFSRWKA